MARRKCHCCTRVDEVSECYGCGELCCDDCLSASSEGTDLAVQGRLDEVEFLCTFCYNRRNPEQVAWN